MNGVEIVNQAYLRQTLPLSWERQGLVKCPMERYPVNLNSLNPGGLAGLVSVYSGRHETLGLELGRALQAETTEGGTKRETTENSTKTMRKGRGTKVEEYFLAGLDRHGRRCRG